MMQRVAHADEFEDADELVNDRIPGLPLLGFLTGTLFSLAIWGAVAVIAWTV
jgi:hypothetical protein